MGALLLAQAGWSIGQLAIGIIIVLAVVAIVYIAARAFGIPIPQWVVQMIVVVIVAVCAIAAIRVLLSA